MTHLLPRLEDVMNKCSYQLSLSHSHSFSLAVAILVVGAPGVEKSFKLHATLVLFNN